MSSRKLFFLSWLAGIAVAEPIWYLVQRALNRSFAKKVKAKASLLCKEQRFANLFDLCFLFGCYKLGILSTTVLQSALDHLLFIKLVNRDGTSWWDHSFKYPLIKGQKVTAERFKGSSGLYLLTLDMYTPSYRQYGNSVLVVKVFINKDNDTEKKVNVEVALDCLKVEAVETVAFVPL